MPKILTDSELLGQTTESTIENIMNLLTYLDTESVETLVRKAWVFTEPGNRVELAETFEADNPHDTIQGIANTLALLTNN